MNARLALLLRRSLPLLVAFVSGMALHMVVTAHDLPELLAEVERICQEQGGEQQ